MATAIKLRSDIKKLKKAIDTKGISQSIKSKLKVQLEKAERELASMQKGGKPRKVSTTKGTKTTLTALQKLIQKKKYGVYQGKGVDLKKDAGEGAMATGRRVSKGLKSNQFGSKGSNKGNVYYEYRPNRIDVKQPRKAQRYPKLEKGGEVNNPEKKKLASEDIMAKGGSVRVYDSHKLYILTVSKDGSKVGEERFRAKSIKEATQMGEDFEDKYKAKFGGDLHFNVKEAEPITENGGVLDIDKIKSEYKANEARNDHSENVVLLAKHFGDDEDLVLAKKIQKKHDDLGHMPQDLLAERDKLSKKLYKRMVEVSAKMSNPTEKKKLEEGGVISTTHRIS